MMNLFPRLNRLRTANRTLAVLLLACSCPLTFAFAPQEESAPAEVQSGDRGMDVFLGLDQAVGNLFFAIEVGDDARAMELIRGGADLTLAFGGETLMDITVRKGRLAVFRALEAAGVAAKTSSGRAITEADLMPDGGIVPVQPAEAEHGPNGPFPHKPLTEAVLAGDLERVALLLTEGADPNEPSRALPPLHHACLGGNGAMVKALVDGGASTDLRDEIYKKTPLEMALSSRGNDGPVAVLLASGVKLDPKQEHPNGTTLLHLAATNGYLHVMRDLIGDAASTNSKSYRTADRKDLVSTPVMGAVMTDETDAVVMLVRRGADLNVKDYLGGTPLWYAHGVHDGLTARMLITGGSDPNLAGRDGEVPLLEAARSGKEEKLRVLLEMGADPNATHKGNTALHQVALNGTWEMATWLLDAGAKADQANNENMTAFQVAVAAGNHLVAHVLAPRESDALLLAIAANDLEAMGQALQLGANPTLGLSDGSTPLHQFARQGAKGFEAAKLFLASGANPNSLDRDGNSPLSELIHEKAHKPFIELLMKSGADPRMGANSAGMLAQRMGSRALMTLLGTRPGIPAVPIITRSGFPHPAAQAGRACELYAGLGDYANALAQIDLAVKAKPNNGRYRLYRAKLRGVTGDAEGSMQDYARILEDKPSWFDPKVDYGILLIENGFFDQGLVHLDEVLTRFVGSPDAKLHVNRGQARAALGDLKGALEDLNLANETRPNDGMILRHLGIAQRLSGDMDSACASWRKAAEAGDKMASALIER
ncbi:MAG: ankyrin repeat domain-containing protein, partial [Planctomycetota bacterium]|nr:ankyrin repeat domain-containing protein [Planctomycetota bacterium]